MTLATEAVEQYRSLRRRALQHELTDAHAEEYLQSRSTIREAALAQQQSNTVAGGRHRSQARAHVRLAISLHLGEWTTDTFINDLSRGGCSLFLNREPDVDSLQFDLYLDGGITVRGVARVVGVRPRGDVFAVSLRFEVMEEEARSAVEDAVLDALVV